MKNADILIIGAGCAGTSLAQHLETAGYSGQVEIYDGQTNFDREQRWCSWGEIPASFEPLVKHSWNSWQISAPRTRIVRNSTEFSYKQIYAPDFFEYFHKKWLNDSSKTRLHKGVKVGAIRQREGVVEVETETGPVAAGLVFDARNRGSQNLSGLKKSSQIFLHQTFLGWTVKFKRPVFDPECATLMDFSTAQKEGLSFMYVLPYSQNEALVESTCFSQKPLDWHWHLANVEDYLARNFGQDYRILSEESGELPMTTAPIKTRIDRDVYAIGIAGGNVRPSSGYAFHRIQRQTRQIAAAITAGRSIPEDFAAQKYNFFDAVFLEAIASQTDSADRFFLKLFEKTDPAPLIRFLLDESSPLDDLKVVAALPKAEFVRALVSNFAGKLLKNVWRKQPQTKIPIRDTVDGLATRVALRNSSR